MYGTAQTFALSLERERFTRTEESGGDTLDLLNDCDLLIIDDLGTEMTTQFVCSALYHVVNTRLMESRPTIISTNLSIREFRDVYSERIFSRITSSYTLLKLTGSDIRIRRKINRTL